jgi:hypothetical protein
MKNQLISLYIHLIYHITYEIERAYNLLSYHLNPMMAKSSCYWLLIWQHHKIEKKKS